MPTRVARPLRSVATFVLAMLLGAAGVAVARATTIDAPTRIRPIVIMVDTVPDSVTTTARSTDDTPPDGTASVPGGDAPPAPLPTSVAPLVPPMTPPRAAPPAPPATPPPSPGDDDDDDDDDEDGEDDDEDDSDDNDSEDDAADGSEGAGGIEGDD
ncbi:MAG: hypothetical protein Q7V88_08040 [Actinomycetota bacterium]|nr:hypothetical protein [Actinomycetota bacterium]